MGESVGLQNRLILEGLQSTHAISYDKNTKKINNHVYPDTDHTKGIELVETSCQAYRQRKDSNGNPIPYVLPSFAKLKEPTYSTITIEKQQKKRDEWLEQIDKMFYKNDVKLLYGKTRSSEKKIKEIILFER